MAVKTSRISPIPRSFGSKGITSTLSYHQNFASNAQSAHKTIAAAAATGFVTVILCDPDQPHQLSPIGSALW